MKKSKDGNSVKNVMNNIKIDTSMIASKVRKK